MAQEDTITSGWDLIKAYQANATASGRNGDMQTEEGFAASYENNDYRPVITVNLASISGEEDVGYKSIRLREVFSTTDDGYTLHKPEYVLEVSGWLPGSGRTDYDGVRASIEQTVKYSGENLGGVFRALTRTGVEGQTLASRVQDKIAGTKYEAMLE